VREIHPRYEVVFTSGGVGPTHDDVTIAGVAAGLGRKVIIHPTLEAKLREYFGDKVNAARLKMAEVVEGTDLTFEGNLFPTVRVENIYVLPGIPELFREKFSAMRQRFAADPFHLRVIYTNEPESTIADFLNRTMEDFPELMLGSYPKLNDPEYRVRITLESKSRDYVEQAFAALIAMLPESAVVRTE
jgi:molybdopterin-biosynthesis enzyme MoeA-like protein